MLTISSPDVHHVSTISSSYLLHVSMVSSSCLHHIVILFSPYLYHIFYHICTVSSPQCHKLSFLHHFQHICIYEPSTKPHNIFCHIFTRFWPYFHTIVFISPPHLHYIYISWHYFHPMLTKSLPYLHQIFTMSSPHIFTKSSQDFIILVLTSLYLHYIFTRC